MSDDKRTLAPEELEEVAGGAVSKKPQRRIDPLLKPVGFNDPTKSPPLKTVGNIPDKMEEILDAKENLEANIRRK